MGLGIENLKIAIVASINLGEKIEKNYSDDGKITLAEALGIGASSFGDIMAVIKSGSEIKNEFLDLTAEERLELIDLVKSELNLEDEKTEKIIENAVEFLFSLEKLIKSF